MSNEGPKKSKGWPRIGSVRKDKNGKSYIKLNEDVEVFVGGTKVEMNKYRTVRLEDPTARIDGLQERGFITEQEADKRRSELAEKSAWLKYELVVPPEGNSKE